MFLTGRGCLLGQRVAKSHLSSVRRYNLPLDTFLSLKPLGEGSCGCAQVGRSLLGMLMERVCSTPGMLTVCLRAGRTRGHSRTSHRSSRLVHRSSWTPTMDSKPRVHLRSEPLFRAERGFCVERTKRHEKPEVKAFVWEREQSVPAWQCAVSGPRRLQDNYV